MKDSFGRQITYARISVTDLCNLRCTYCMPEGVEKKPHKDILRIEELQEISDALAELGVNKQRITGGEPLVRKGLMNLLSHIGANPAVETLGITTNGQLLGTMAHSLRESGVKAVNISLDTLDEKVFASLTKGGSLQATLAGVDAAIQEGFKTVKINSVLLKGINDRQIKPLADYARQKGVQIRFIELMPFCCQTSYAEQYYISSREVTERYRLKHLVDKSTSKKVSVFAFDDGTEVGFISPISNKFCEDCNRLRITADGMLLNCLHDVREYNLKPYIKDKERLKDYINECIQNKPREHGISEGRLQERYMEEIGG